MNKNIMTFDEWAILGKDKGMEKGHHNSVTHMLDDVFEYYQKNNQKYSVMDLGCGNGWVVRKFKKHSLCNLAHGLDGAANMIKKAQKHDPKGMYFLENIETWTPTKKYDIVFSMETLYYFKCPNKIVEKIYNALLNKNGMIIIGIDHYLENEESLNWGKQFNLNITTFSIEEWKNIFKNVGFKNITCKQVEQNKNWKGTLVIKGEK